MELTKIKIDSYKSIGEDSNVLYLDKKTTAIIGKNESGKSNVLEAIGKLPYFGKTNRNYFSSKNRNLNKGISVVFELESSDMELERHGEDYSNTVITINEDLITLEGGLSEELSSNKQLIDMINDVISTEGNRDIWNVSNNDHVKQQHKDAMEYLKSITEKISFNYERYIETLQRQIQKTFERKDEINSKLEEIQVIISRYYSLLPRIFYREMDDQLEYSYNVEDVKEHIKNKRSIFYRLMLASKISNEEMIRAFEEKVEGAKQSIREDIEDKININIGNRFNEFYTQEEVRFKTKFEGNTIKFLVNTNKGKTMLITERSNGLRWYMSLFIDVLADDLERSPVLFLFDEPGVHLHVNAQKELLNLFNDLTKKGHKIIYTTHSPSMIDGENISNIRVVEKNTIGNTVIYNSCYNQKLNADSKMETLSPLVKAIGADLRFNLGPQFSKKNIVTEGISDYLYLKAIMNYLDIKEQPHIIPAAGVENINRIVSILIGWGCEYKVLLDYDNAGWKEYNTIVEKLERSLEDNITFINGETYPDANEMKRSPITIENIISSDDFKGLSNFKNRSGKVLVAKEFYDKVSAKEFTITQSTIDSFQKVLSNLKVL